MNKVIFIKDKETVAHLPFLIKILCAPASEAFVRINWIETDGFTEPSDGHNRHNQQPARKRQRK